ncbi:Carbon-nitrogen hydrolase [Naviculisporaceae sp. PSN 640]
MLPTQILPRAAAPGPGKIRLGTASPGTQPSTPETLAALARIAQQASTQRIDILLLPEAYIGGYPRGTHFGCTIGARTQEGRDEYLSYFKNAVDLGDIVGDGGAGGGYAWIRRELPEDNPGAVLPLSGSEENGVGAKAKRGDGTREELERIARETGVFLVVGCIEKCGGSMYCSAVYVCPSRGMIGKRRKVMPTGTERLVWAQGSPATLQAVSTIIRGIRVNMGTAICWENYMPLLRQSLYAQNINLYLAPTADGRDTWLSLLRTIGIEGRCFVVSSNMCVRDPSSSASGSQPLAINAPPPASAPEHAVQQQGGQNPGYPNRRRTSFITEDGHEIVIPPAPSQPPSHHPHPQPGPGPSVPSTNRRRRSVFDEYGNEIVLSCPDDDEGNDVDSAGADTSAVSVSVSGETSPTRTSFTGSGRPRQGLTWPDMAARAAGGQRHAPNPPPKPLDIGVANGHATSTKAQTQSQTQAFVSRGGSSIISPFGEVLAGPQWEDDVDIISVDVDFDDCIRGRLDLDTAGSYSRNDSFRFWVEGLDLTPLPY